jgi:hypothetical protein
VKTYTAHLKPERHPVLVREGWSWGSALFGPVWLLIESAWIPALLEIAALAILFALAPPQFWRPALLGLALLNGLIGRDFVRWSLQRRGYAFGHVVLAPDRDAALLRLFTARPDLTALINPAR